MFTNRIKNLLNITFFILLSTKIYAKVHSDPTSLFTIKIYAEPNNRQQKFSYIMSLPKWEYYSYYLGSDLPTWHVVHNSVFKGTFNSGELVNIRIHSQKNPKNNMNKNSMAHLIINDENSHIIWEGEFNYSEDKMNILTQNINQKDYVTTLKFDTEIQTEWLEIQTLIKK